MHRMGVAYTPSPGAILQYLPLKEVHVRALIVDVSARVILKQTFGNPQDTSTTRCKYVFPVPASAAICAFRMTSDGRTINGICKEKQAAQEDYERGLHEGRLAGLVNYVTDDIFTISIGAVPAWGTAEIYLEYVMTLANDDGIDQIRFQLPQTVGDRYGTTPTQLNAAFQPSFQTKIKITCDIQMTGQIREVTSPSHGDEIKETKYPVSGGRFSRRRTTIRFRSQNYLDRDFVLLIRASRLDAPRCFVEVQMDAEEGYHTLAFQLTLVPKEDLPPILTQEYLFVVDRSGSMHDRISTAKDTLSLLLRMLPAKGSSFNIFIFDDDVEGLWRSSQEYNEATLLEASYYISTIHVGGGTEMAKALRFILQRRKKDVPAAVFLLTDGEVHSNEPIQVVSEAVHQAPEKFPLRVFVLGIGSGISTATCDGIARAGNGVGLYALDIESILVKCARLLIAGRSPLVRNVTIDWGLLQENFGTSTVKFRNQTLSPKTVATTLPPAVQQAPTEVRNIHAATRMNVYAIILMERVDVPKNIVLHGQLDQDGTSFELPISIEEVRLAGVDDGSPLVHTLAAWHLIQEHEERRAPLPQPLLPATDDELRKAVITRLGEKYQLASQHTAFVAVDSGQDDTSRRRLRGPSPQSDQIPASQSTGHLGVLGSLVGLISGILGYQSVDRFPESQQIPGSWWDPPQQAEADGGDYTDGMESDDSKKTFTTLSSLESCNWSDWSEPASPVQDPQHTDNERGLPSPKILQRSLDTGVASKSQYQPHSLGQLPVDLVIPPEVVTLLKLQSYDGSYQLNGPLRSIVGSKAINEARNWNVDDKVWATALSIAFLRKVGQAVQKEVLDDLMGKAMVYLSSATDVDVEQIIRRASEVIQ